MGSKPWVPVLLAISIVAAVGVGAVAVARGGSSSDAAPASRLAGGSGAVERFCEVFIDEVEGFVERNDAEIDRIDEHSGTMQAVLEAADVIDDMPVQLAQIYGRLGEVAPAEILPDVQEAEAKFDELPEKMRDTADMFDDAHWRLLSGAGWLLITAFEFDGPVVRVDEYAEENCDLPMIEVG